VKGLQRVAILARFDAMVSLGHSTPIDHCDCDRQEVKAKRTPESVARKSSAR
jgi:hypothetical protein